MTGHPLGDAVLPAAVRLVGAVRLGYQSEITDAIAEAYRATNYHPLWMTALVLVLAGMVPEESSAGDLLAWNR